MRRRPTQQRISRRRVQKIPGGHLKAVIASIALIGALRVLFFCAAFPLFNNVDEQAHFDVILRYAAGERPVGLRAFRWESARLIELYGSTEYYLPFRAPRAPAEVAATQWRGKINHETTQPPVYYLLASLWYRLGLGLGLSERGAIYWIRCLDAPLYGALIVLAFFAAAIAAPADIFLQIGVPLLLAVFPQDAFYSMNNDVLSPLLGTAVFYGLARIIAESEPSAGLCAATGLCAAAACLVKTSNVVLLGLVTGVALLKRRGWSGHGRAALLACSLSPVLWWMDRNRRLLGDFTGVAEATRLYGWSPKPLTRLWPHPIFTPRGLVFFWSSLMKAFWRGEFIWHGLPLAGPAADFFYWTSSTLLLGICAASLRGKPLSRRVPEVLGFAMLALYVLFLVWVSISYDFGDHWIPSRSSPFYISGRIIGGCLVPFLLLYVKGLDAACARLRVPRVRWAALLSIVTFVAAADIVRRAPIFLCADNWLH